MNNCVFCKIVKKEIPSKIEKETDDFLVFQDINPSAPTHLLIVPKKHYVDITEAPESLWLEVKKIAEELAESLNLSGFRLATNVGDIALVHHMHVHFLGGIKKERGL